VFNIGLRQFYYCDVIDIWILVFTEVLNFWEKMQYNQLKSVLFGHKSAKRDQKTMNESGNPFALITQDEDIERASRSMKAMSHPLRLKILCTLGEKELSVQDIVEQVGTSQSNISQHLAILRDKGILASRKDANRVYYRVGDSRTLRLISMMRDVFCSFCA
jgi:ArsR family transcriptional regulator